MHIGSDGSSQRSRYHNQYKDHCINTGSIHNIIIKIIATPIEEVNITSNDNFFNKALPQVKHL